MYMVMFFHKVCKDTSLSMKKVGYWTADLITQVPDIHAFEVFMDAVSFYSVFFVTAGLITIVHFYHFLGGGIGKYEWCHHCHHHSSPMTGCFLSLLPSSFYWDKEAVAKVRCLLPSPEMAWSHGDTNRLGIKKRPALCFICYMTLGRPLNLSFLNTPSLPCGNFLSILKQSI